MVRMAGIQGVSEKGLDVSCFGLNCFEGRTQVKDKNGNDLMPALKEYVKENDYDIEVMEDQKESILCFRGKKCYQGK